MPAMEKLTFLIGVLLVVLSSCSVIEKASNHEFDSDYYVLRGLGDTITWAYVDVQGSKLDVYRAPLTAELTPFYSINLEMKDSVCHHPVTFTANTLDLDLTSVLMKYRPSLEYVPAQLTTDFNAALYAGWRHDKYYIRTQVDPLGKCSYKMINRGYDFGLFAGLGSTTINTFANPGGLRYDYSGLILQGGAAAFLETSFASFGLAVGADYLPGKYNTHWIYQRKPWVGFVVGIALK